MSNASKQGEGAVEELGGKIKQTVGAIIGNDKKKMPPMRTRAVAICTIQPQWIVCDSVVRIV